MSEYGLQVWSDEGVLVLNVDEAPSRFICSFDIDALEPDLTFDLFPYLPDEPVDLTVLFQVEFAGLHDYGLSSEINELYQVYITGTQLRIIWTKTNCHLKGTALVLAI